MTPEEFNNYSLYERGDLLFQKGKFIEITYEYTKEKRCLYHLYDFIVDVIVNKETNKITEVKAWMNNYIIPSKK